MFKLELLGCLTFFTGIYFVNSTDDIPNSFKYGCKSDGLITVNKTELKNNSLVLLREGTQVCNIKNGDKQYQISGCKKGSHVQVILEKASNIVGGQFFKAFDIVCEDHSYNVTVEMTAFNISAATATPLSPVTPSHGNENLQMKLVTKGNIDSTGIKVAELGTQLSLVIYGDSSVVAAIDPISCTAYSNSPKSTYAMWDDTSNCGMITDVIGGNWAKQTQTSGKTTVALNIFAFHLKDSNILNIRCSVRICPVGLANNNECSLACKSPTKTNGRRRRDAKKDTDPALRKVHTSIFISDTDISQNHGDLKKSSFMVLAVCLMIAILK